MYLDVATVAAVDIAACFAENLIRCRKRAGISQEELGIRASLHRTEISQLERGLRIARIDTLVKLAGALSIPPYELIDGIAWTPGGAPTSGEFKRATTPPPQPDLN
ncbi:MAG TPA: helix-turn-helix transcriptional regulator [Solirubrobacterales bacterium]|nr:helix-turn-helix transcriptional regulator [Solirubrobacterales bacterium]